MKTKLLHEDDGARTFVLVLDTGDEALASLTAFAAKHRLGASRFTAIGAFSNAVVAYFDWTMKNYKHISVAEQVEVLSLIGDIADDRGTPKIHAHVVLGKADATAHGGHLVSGHVRPTLEIVLTETPPHLRRRFDPDSGLALIDLAAEGRDEGGGPAPCARSRATAQWTQELAFPARKEIFKTGRSANPCSPRRSKVSDGRIGKAGGFNESAQRLRALNRVECAGPDRLLDESHTSRSQASSPRKMRRRSSSSASARRNTRSRGGFDAT
jgi:uncharacterized protein